MPEFMLPAGYSRVVQGDCTLVIADHCRTSLLDFFATPLDAWSVHPDARAHAGKGRHFSVPLPGSGDRVFVRRWTRGGGVSWLGRWYAGPRRAMRELAALVRARSLGVNVPEPLAVCVEPAPFGCRLTTVMREVSTDGDLPSFLGAFGDRDATVARRQRRLLAVRAGDAVGRLCRGGVFPCDLHLRNVLVVSSGPGPSGVCLVDLDPVRLFDEGTPADDPSKQEAAVATLGRLLRSLRRWTRAGLRCDRTDIARFARAYASSAGMGRDRARAMFRRIGRAVSAVPVKRDARGITLHGPSAVGGPSPRSVLFKMPNWLGDAVMAMPLLEGARRAWPEADLAVMTDEKLKDLFLLSPVRVRVLSYSRGREAATLAEARQGGFDVMVSIPRSLGAAWLAGRCGGAARVGYDGPFRRWFYTHRVRLNGALAGRHRVETYWTLGAPFAFGPCPPPPRLVLPDGCRRDAEEQLAAAGIRGGECLVGINPGAAYGPAKQWPADRFSETARALSRRPGVRLLVFGSSAEAPISDALAVAAGPAAVSFAGRTTLTQLAALIASCRVFITNDTGPMHVAAALGIPVVAVFGSTDAAATGPYGAGHRVVRVPVPCAPCLLRRCPIDFRCMRGIPADRVIDTAERMLA